MEDKKPKYELGSRSRDYCLVINERIDEYLEKVKRKRVIEIE